MTMEMGYCKVTLAWQEKTELQDIASKGNHAVAKVINALNFFNCDQSGGRSERKVDRVKKKLVPEGLEWVLNRQTSQHEYALKVDDRLEAQLVAISCSELSDGMHAGRCGCWRGSTPGADLLLRH